MGKLKRFNEEIAIYNKTLLIRYDKIIQEFIDETEDEVDVNLILALTYCVHGRRIENADKLSGWVGFVKGVLLTQGLLTLEEIQDFDKRYKSDLYEKYGLGHESDFNIYDISLTSLMARKCPGSSQVARPFLRLWKRLRESS